MKVPNLKKILEPTWSHKPGYGWNAEFKELRKQGIKEQATTPEDPLLLKKLGIKKRDNVLAIATYYASWASKLKEAGAKVTYSDISKPMVDYVKRTAKIRFEDYICSNYELIPQESNKYDWTFTFEACGGHQGLPVAYLRSLFNKKGGILVLFVNKDKPENMGGKPKTYPSIVKTLAKIYDTRYSIKKTSIKGHRKGQPTTFLPHIIYTIRTNNNAREKASLDIRVLDYIDNKRVLHLNRDSKILDIQKKELRRSINRLNNLSNLIKSDFIKNIFL